jgi:DNA replication initiation complex subunit (GINS family)
LTEASFDALRKVQLHEKSYAALSQVDEDFFEKYRLLLHKLRERLRSDFSLEAATAFEETRKLLTEVMRKREQKLFLKALRDFHSGDVDSNGLAREEKEVYLAAVKLLSTYEQNQLGSQPSEKKEALIEVKFLSDVPAFIGSSSQLGPFAAKQTARLPAEDARLLIEQGMAQEA